LRKEEHFNISKVVITIRRH